VDLHAREVPLERLLAELGQEVGFEIAIHGALDEFVTVSFSGLSVEDILQRLIGRHSYILRRDTADAASGGEAAELRRVDIFVSAGPAGLAGNSIDDAPPDSVGADPTVVALDHINDPNPLVRRAALQQAYGMAPEQAVPLLGSVLRTHPDPAVRAGAIDILADIGAAGAFDALAGSLGDADPDLRLNGARALHGLDDHRAVHNLGQLLYGDRDPAVRRAAARLLAAQDHQAARALLADFREDDDEVIKGLALGDNPGNPVPGEGRR
jgi:HEAT repeat protein